MAAAIASKNDGQFSAGNTVNIPLTNAPSAGGTMVVGGSFYTGAATGGPSVGANGGSGVVVTEKVKTTGAAATTGVGIWTIDYTTAPTSVDVSLVGAGTEGYGTACCMNITGQASGTYVDVVSTGTTGASTSPTDTNLPNLTDATDLVIGVLTREGTTGTIAPGTNWSQVTEIDEANATFQTLSVISRSPGSTGAFDPTWTLSSSDTWRVAGIAIKSGAGGGGSSIKRSVPHMTGGMRDLTGGTS